MNGYSNLLEKLDYLNSEQILVVDQAHDFADKAHIDQFRRSGEPYITHPIAVAGILADMRMDFETIAAALMHDVIEDCGVSEEQMVEHFGDSITRLVDGVTKINSLSFSSKAEEKARTIRKTLLAMAQDIRVIIIKLADRLHNMRTLGPVKLESRRRKAQETLEIYAPIALRLGMYSVHNELEDLCFHALYPMRAERIGRAVEKRKAQNQQRITHIREEMLKLMEEQGIEAEINYRQKHLWSIYRKMKDHQKRKSFDEIMDVFGYRIIVKDLMECYTTLGILHNHFKLVPGRLKDYIALPKANGYQSLHTTLLVARGLPVEVQIRTEDMDRLANKGIAAHWTYKIQSQYSSQQMRAQQLVSNILELQKSTGSSEEFLEHLKQDLFPDEVNVFTPKGDIVVLPKHATPIDFAYDVHSDIGNQCIGALVDGRAAPLNTALKSGQTIEIITSNFAKPSSEWLNFAVSGKARSSIRQFLKKQKMEDALHMGERLFNEAVEQSQAESQLPALTPDTVQNIFPEISEGIEGVYREIGLGERHPVVTVYQLLNPSQSDAEELTDQTKLSIKGANNLVTNYAHCCFPVPNDAIVGHISTGRGIVVHRTECRNMLKDMRKNPSHWIALTWEDNAEDEFLVGLTIQLKNQRGVIAKLASEIAACYSNIHHIVTPNIESRLGAVYIEITVNNRKHLATIMRKLRRLKEVVRIQRQMP
ncbi:MAG: bifunctional (p)ppGpp synthetase/guanosine-3',5'-bis(diphosphate) 3'-pyrophosphohydrolase [Pseudomonadota bacterium]|nr:bifunctional (p)ppGpp synthetase/guanosine-3',5'-bis(diphosphate) 3'-pyrophosphohydrolase [Pseudomonadota bacterium]